MELDNKYASTEYWTQLIQIQLYNYINNYLTEHNMSNKDFADKLGVTKGYVSQILNGDFDHKLSKLVELALACDLVPKIEFLPKNLADEVVNNTYQNTQISKKEIKAYPQCTNVEHSYASECEPIR